MIHGTDSQLANVHQQHPMPVATQLPVYLLADEDHEATLA